MNLGILPVVPVDSQFIVTSPDVPPPVKPSPATTLVISPVVGVAHEGTPEARVNTWPSDPLASLASVVEPEA